uniref:Uncharacterized protein n=1 Tax=Strigops habroptila TaxID=2489341 RepID=A0A672TZV3_STRHB
MLVQIAKGNLSELEKTLKDNDINALNSSSETLLHVAAANGHVTIMEYLISKGAKVDVKDKNGRTPLHRAAEKGHGDAVKGLLRSGAYLYSLDTEGKTPLHLAAQNDHSHIVMMLLKEEARSYRKQHNFLHMAALKDESSLAKTVDSTMAERKNLPGIVAALIDRGTDRDALNDMRYTPLLLACETGKAEAAEVLIKKGANFGMRTPASDTALHLAVQAGADSIAHLLLQKGMETNLRNQAHETPLHIAALHNKGALVGLLVNAGAQINAATKEFVTPLHIASQRGNTDAAQQVLPREIDLPSLSSQPHSRWYVELIQLSPQMYLNTGRSRIAESRALHWTLFRHFYIIPSNMALADPETLTIIILSVFQDTIYLDFAFLCTDKEINRICCLLTSLSSQFQHKDEMFRIKRLQQSLLVQNVCIAIS